MCSYAFVFALFSKSYAVRDAVEISNACLVKPRANVRETLIGHSAATRSGHGLIQSHTNAAHRAYWDPSDDDESDDITDEVAAATKTGQGVEETASGETVSSGTTGGQRSVPIVEMALYMNNLDEISSRSGKWTGDIVVRSRYRIADFENRSVKIELLDGKIDYRNEVRHWRDDENITKTEHLYVTMHYDGYYDQFPFDSQELIVAVQLKGLAAQEARFVEWLGFSGIRPYNEGIGRHFQTRSFYTSSWSIGIQDYHEFGIPYSKSRAELRVVVSRNKVIYFLTCSFIPSLAIMFAMSAFWLPVTLIVPRVTISFTSFLAIFVHMKQMALLVPDGVWCWLLTDLIFYCAVLGASITSNIASARMNTISSSLANSMDAFIRWALPAEFITGQIFITVLRRYHRWVGGLCITVIVFIHVSAIGRLFAEACAEDGNKEPNSLLADIVSFFRCCCGDDASRPFTPRRARQTRNQQHDDHDDHGEGAGLGAGAEATGAALADSGGASHAAPSTPANLHLSMADDQGGDDGGDDGGGGGD